METVWLTPDAAPAADALVFTSETGVLGWTQLHQTRGKAYCVGDRTAAVAREAGFDAQSAGGDARDLAAMLEGVPSQVRLVHVRGRHIAADMGALAAPYIVYDQKPLPLTSAALGLLAGEGTVVLPFFSPRSVALFKAQNSPLRATLIPVAISPAVATAVRDANLSNALVADTPDAGAMLRVIASAVA